MNGRVSGGILLLEGTRLIASPHILVFHNSMIGYFTSHKETQTKVDMKVAIRIHKPNSKIPGLWL